MPDRATRPASARPTSSVKRSAIATVRPATARPAVSNLDSLNPFLLEIQKKLKSKEFSPEISHPVLITKPMTGKKPLIGLLEEKLPDPSPQTAHKRYSSVYPCSSKLLAKKWDDATWKRHKEKIKTMKACIDNVHSAEKPSTLRSLKKSIAKQG